MNTLTGTCVQCAVSCAQCSGPSTCSACFVEATGPTGISQACTCPFGTYPDLATATCKACSVQFCSTCTATTCSNCILPRVLTAGICSCTGNSFSDGINCVSCPLTCTSCTNSGCTDCNSGYYLTPAFRCESACPDGTYISGRLCVKCPNNCQKCNAPDTCLLCPANTFNNKGQCVASCPSETFPSNANCVDCDPKCKTCRGTASQCLECKDPALVLFGSDCIASCPDKTVRISGSCQACLNPDCLKCGPTTDFCFKCITGKYASRGQCYDTCPSGTVPWP